MPENPKQRSSKLWILLFVLILAAIIVWSFFWNRGPRPGEVKDEALQVGRDASSFKAADEPYFQDMDGGVQLDPIEVQGRNTWIVWTAGNDRLWDQLIYNSAGALDFLKVLSSSPSLPRWLGPSRCRCPTTP